MNNSIFVSEVHPEPYDAFNQVQTMVDAAGTTAYGYTEGGLLWTEKKKFPAGSIKTELKHKDRPRS